MKTNINIKVQETLNSVESIAKVEVSPFFKENVMYQIRNTSEEIQNTTWYWFTPKLQLATLFCVIVLNIIAFSNFKTTTYDDKVDSFAESYGLSTRAVSIILN
ncbi:hypothetical protein [Winogradskyella sp. PG-2]|uniref:hypothetical protein n=1 Tax=Winogradskyella sp. PG-2 TaxID=754409 RepID=UPI0004586C12|nr:hypothetical protein [Winogradskyella sp. PG-2]BAO76797.1 hypothetical protein WPG_2567 [Winogradskyella sp. PG-2]